MALLAFDARAQSGPRRIQATALPLHLDDFTLVHGQTVEYRTMNTTQGVDPVMHLLRLAGSTWSHVTSNDDFVGLESRIQHTNSTGATQRYLVAVRTKGSFGVTTVLRNGVERTALAPVGGQIIPVAALGFGPNDEIRTNHGVGQSVAHVLFSLTTTSGLTVGRFGLMNTPGRAARIMATTLGTDKFYVVGTPWVQTDAVYVTPRFGGVHLFGNDHFTDSDQDGVGNALEAFLGTCAFAPCTHGYLPRDSDRDGLTDGEELWGVAGTSPTGFDEIAFARWGADPRHKDVFVEVDWISDFGGLVPPATNPYLHFGPAWTSNWVNEVRQALLAAPAAHIKNPNGQNGIQLHLDLGVDPSNAMHEDRYGAYGTVSNACVVRDYVIVFHETVAGSVTLVINGVSGPPYNVTGLPPALALWALLFYAFPPSVAAEVRSFDSIPNTPSWRARIRSTAPCTNLTASLGHNGVDPHFEDKVDQRYEGNEELKYRNRSPYPEVDAVRRTRFRYAVLSSDGQSSEDRFNFGIDTQTFVHELGHTLGLQHWGRKEWSIQHNSPPFEQEHRNCLPHYRSIMSYAYQRPSGFPFRFAHEDGLVFNPAAVHEGLPFGPAGAGLPAFNVHGDWSYIHAPWLYAAGPSSVDFDRDLAYSPPSLMRSFGLIAHDGHCRAFEQGQQTLAETPVRGSVGLVRVSNHLHALWVQSNGVHTRSAPLGPQGQKSCTGDPGGMDTTNPCLAWSVPSQLLAGTTYHGLSAIRFGTQLFVALTRTDHHIEIRRYNVAGATLSEVTPAWVISNPGTAASRTRLAPELVLLHSANHNGRLALVHRSEDNDTFQLHTYNPGPATWSSPAPLSGPTPGALTGAQAAGSLVWPGPDVTSWSNSERRTLLALPGTDHRCRLFLLRPTGTSDIWDEIAGWDGRQCRSQPSLALRTRRSTSGVADSMVSSHIMLVHAAGFGNHVTPWVTFSSRVWRNQLTTNLPPITASSYWGEGWTALAPDANIAVYSDATMDNVFALGGLEVTGGPRPVFFPHGDAAPDFAFGANSDFRVMENEICRLLRTSAPSWDADAVCKAYVNP